MKKLIERAEDYSSSSKWDYKWQFERRERMHNTGIPRNPTLPYICSKPAFKRISQKASSNSCSI